MLLSPAIDAYKEESLNRNRYLDFNYLHGTHVLQVDFVLFC